MGSREGTPGGDSWCMVVRLKKYIYIYISIKNTYNVKLLFYLKMTQEHVAKCKTLKRSRTSKLTGRKNEERNVTNIG